MVLSLGIFIIVAVVAVIGVGVALLISRKND